MMLTIYFCGTNECDAHKLFPSQCERQTNVNPSSVSGSQPLTTEKIRNTFVVPFDANAHETF